MPKATGHPLLEGDLAQDSFLQVRGGVDPPDAAAERIGDPDGVTADGDPEAGLPARTLHLEFEPQVRAIEAAMAVRDEGTVPCDLLAENFIDVGGEFKLIDYEYSGNNDACFELGNVERVEPLLDFIHELDTTCTSASSVNVQTPWSWFP